MLSSMVDVVEEQDEIDMELSFKIAKACISALKTQSTQDEGRRILVYIMNNWKKVNPNSRDMWVDLFESAGFYPYLEKYHETFSLNSTASIIRKGFFKSSNLPGIYFHEEQLELLKELNFGRNLIVSAPTSFGKSLLIEEIISSKKFKNVVVIQPTLALLDETRKKLLKYGNEYKIIVKTTQQASTQKGNVFLLTAERVMEYSKLPPIDFLVLDEFYKLSAKRDDERSDVLNNAFYMLLSKHRCKFMLLGPNIKDISPGFAEAYNACFYVTSYSLVVNEEINYYSQYVRQFGDRGEKRLFKENKLFELLYSLQEEQTIVFCSSPSRARDLSMKYSDFLIQKKVEKATQLPLVEWISKNIHPQWSLVACLNNKIGVHDGALPRHITSSIIDYFNCKKLNCLFCTTTIIEGVNTSARNIIYYDKTKGFKKNIDYFDYSNIKGRAGRMMVHLIGRIYNFNPPPPKEDIIVDIPFFEQNPISDEILINLEHEQVKYPESEQYQYLQNLPDHVMQIIRRNGVNVKGQISIIEQLKWVSDFSLITWKGYPTYQQLKFILGLAWDHLIKPGEATQPMTKGKLVKQTYDYSQTKSINGLIQNNYDYYISLPQYGKASKIDILNDAIRDAFQTLRHWLEYKVPKWLSVINSLQEYVCSYRNIIPGNYLYFANLIENEFLPPNLTLLLEYNIPVTAIRKLMTKLPDNIQEDNVLSYISTYNLAEACGLTEYERSFL